MKKIEVNSGLLIGLGGLAGVSVLGLVFMLGRESAMAKAAPSPSPMSGLSGGAVPPSAAPQNASPLPAQGDASLTPLEVPPPISVTATPIPLPVVATPSSNQEAEATRQGVIHYFRALEALQPNGGSGNSESMARDIVGSLLKGDASGFDDLTRQAKQTRDRMKSVTPPAPCVAHYRESVALLNEELAMMDSLKQAMEGSGSSNLAADLNQKGNALRSRSEALQAHEKALRARYGVP